MRSVLELDVWFVSVHLELAISTSLVFLNSYMYQQQGLEQEVCW